MKKIISILFLIFLCNSLIAQQTAVEVTYPQYQYYAQYYFSHLKYITTGSYAGTTHFGKDIRGNYDSQIKALANGIVVEKFNTGAHSGMGNGIRIKYPGIGVGGQDLFGLYLHFSSHVVNEGDPVIKGQLIGYMGNSGTDSVHCHFELRYFNTLFSPFLQGGNSCNALNIYQCGSSQNNPSWAAQWENPVTFLVNNPRVTLITPSHDTSINGNNLQFTWSPVLNSTAYRIQISTSQLFNSTAVDQNVGNNTSFTWNAQPNTEYFWRVKSSLTPGFDNNDEVRRFTTIPNAPTLVTPAFGAGNVSNPVQFSWSAVNGANSYRIQVSDNAAMQNESFTGPYLVDYPPTGVNTLTQYTWNNALPNKTYYWRVRVNTNKGTSLYNVSNFSTATGIPPGSGGSAGLNYWFDNGAITSTTIANNTDVQLSTSGVTPGYHVANFYFQNPSGSRSSITSNGFVKTTGNSYLSKLEYWYDTAFTQRQSLNVTSLDYVERYLPTSQLSAGTHVLHTRTQLQAGMWSSVTSTYFIKNNSGSSSGVKEMEYWFDDAFGSRQTLNIIDPNDIDAEINTDLLALGSHVVYYRFKIDGELWSSISASNFSKATTGNGITQMEYWFNNDFDNRQISPLVDIENIDETINTSGLPLGTNTLYTRFQYEGGWWSSVTATCFLKNQSTNGPIQYQYWYDSLIGIAKTVTINATTNPFDVDVYTDASSIDTGWHIILSRFRQAGGLWSSITVDSFYKNTSTTYCNITNPPTGDSLAATKFLCQQQIILDPQDGIVNENKITRNDLAKITYRGLMGINEPETLADSLPSLFSDLQTETPSNSYYFKAAKVLSYLTYGDNIPPFNPSRINFYPQDTIVRGYVLKVLLEAWDIKPDTTVLPMSLYADLVPGAEVNGYILKAAQLGLIRRPDIDGPNFENFRPYAAATRIEAFLMLHRLMLNVGKPEITNEDFYLPYNRNYITSQNPGVSDGNFSSYGENPFTIKGVPSLNFSFNYNASLIDLPDEVTQGKNDDGKLVYDQENMGVGWTHSYNAYIIHDKGIDGGNADDRYLIYWPGGDIQVYDPNTNKGYTSLGVYDELATNNPFSPSVITIKTKSQVVYRFELLAGNSATNILHLVSITDRHNNAVSLLYENGYSANAGINIKRLKEVNDGHGRKFNFEYISNSNLIDSVRAIAGALEKTVGFNYVARRLVKYSNPKKDFSIYNYGTLPGQEYLITKIVLPKGNIITNTYTTNRKLNTSKFNNSQQTTVQTTPVYNVAEPFTTSKITTTVDGQTQIQNIRNNKYSLPDSVSGPGYNNKMLYNNTLNNSLLPSLVQNNLTQVQVLPVYDLKGNLLSITKKDAANTINITESYAYNSLNDITSRIDGNSNTTTFEYNGTGQLTKVNAPIGSTSIAPNTNGTVQSITNPSGIVTSFAYDSYGNLAQTNMPLAITTSNGYDAYGRMISSTNPNNKAVIYQYDENDNLKQETYDQPGLNYITQYRFDKNDNLIEVENAKGDITYLTYNDNDQLVKEQFGAYAKRYAYTEDGRMKTFTSPNGVNFTNLFNANDQLTNDGYATYTYNADNTLNSISRNGKTTTYNYDALKRIIKTTFNDFAGNTVEYDYDNNNNIKKVNYRNGAFIVKYNYDANNRLDSVTDNSGRAWASYTYLTDGRLNTQTNRNGTIIKYFYDAVGRMDSMVNTKADASIIAAYGYTMDKVGNHLTENTIQPLTMQVPEFSHIDSFAYSNTNRLLKQNADNYTYDDNGNLLTIDKNSNTVAHTYDIKNNLLTYNDGSNNITYEYDALGQRRRRNGTSYVLDNAYNVLAETDLNGNAQYYYIYGLGLIARVKVANSEPYYYHYDYRGSTVAITNTAQAITHKYNYGAFGETQQAIEEDYNTYRYVGKYGVGYEAKDLTFMRARYYQPTVGRFNSEDPVWGVNLYPYGGNNGINFIDPKGLFIEGDILNFAYDRKNGDNTPGIDNIQDLRNFISYNAKEARAAKDIETKKLFLSAVRAGLNLKFQYDQSIELKDETRSPFSKDRAFYTEINSKGYNIYKGKKLANGDLYFSVLSGSMLYQKGGVAFRYNWSTPLSWGDGPNPFQVLKGNINYNQLPMYNLITVFSDR